MSHAAEPTQTVAPVKGIFDARVIANEPICREHWRLVLEIERFPAAAPGQFVQVQCADSAGDALNAGMMLRRPFSIGGLQREGQRCTIEILHRAIGRGTKWLAARSPGDIVNVLGPLGRPFHLPERPARALLVGGGIGLPPLLWLAEALHAAGHLTIAFCGARSGDLLPLSVDAGALPAPGEAGLCVREFSRSGTPALIATDDGSLGWHGYVPQAFEAYLDAHPGDAKDAIVYACGPEAMLRASAFAAEQRGLTCMVCLERVMACGMGTCQSCIVRVHDRTAADGWRYRLCCTDGPVFDSRDVVWA